MEKKRAAAYARVSTNSRTQAHSFEKQSEYWNRELSSNPQYEYVGLFADQGISGRSMAKRPQMLKLIELCRQKQVDVIFTKSVQRIARNTVELLNLVHELRDIGIGIYFENENINSLQPNADMFITMAVMVAESDLERYSKNVAWTYQKKFKSGEIAVGFQMYGYKSKDCQVEIVPEQAKVVKQLFEMYATGEWSVRALVKYLNDNNIKSKTGKIWKEYKLIELLRNEKYCGDAIWQKYTTKLGDQKRNRGVLPKYYVENSHEGIISRELFQKVQALMDTRSNKKAAARGLVTHDFTGKIVCGECGANFHHKINASGTKYAKGIWGCTVKIRDGRDACPSHSIKDTVIREKFIEAFNEFAKMNHTTDEEGTLQAQINKLCEQENEIASLAVKGYISQKDADIERQGIADKIREYNEKLE